jgi:phytanoyl-CoA hydroxylase
LAGLTQAQQAQFQRDGYLIVEDIVDERALIAPLVAEYERRLGVLMDDLYARGEISSSYDDLPFGRRLTALYKETSRGWSQYFDFSLPFKQVQADEPCHFGPMVFAMLTNPALLDIVESIVGPEILSNPVQHVRLKPPDWAVTRDPRTGVGLNGVTQWHQDASVVTEEADETNIVTVWIPIVDADETNGCLQLVPRNHDDGLLQHCISADVGKYLPTRNFAADRAVPVPMKRGSVLLMNRMTPHGSLPNRSEDVRWSMDLRYQAVGLPTGRPEFPSFVARSRSNPASELHDAGAWRDSWLLTRAHMAEHPEEVRSFTRWKADAPGCA